jgi:hypothetical protein
MTPATLRESVDEATLADLQSMAAAHGKSLAVWLSGWRDELVRFDQERDQPREAWSHTTQHRHDWVGLLHVRDFVESALHERGARISAPVTSWLSSVDDFMCSFTEDVAGWNPEGRAEDRWWWSRLPVSGPVRAGWWADG